MNSDSRIIGIWHLGAGWANKAFGTRVKVLVCLLGFLGVHGCATAPLPDLVIYDGEDAAILRDDPFTVVEVPYLQVAGNQHPTPGFDARIIHIDDMYYYLALYDAIRVSPGRRKLEVETYIRTDRVKYQAEGRSYRYTLYLTTQPGTEYVFRPVAPGYEEKRVDFMINVTGPVDNSFIELCEPVKEGGPYGASDNDSPVDCDDRPKIPLAESPHLRPSPLEQFGRSSK
jgi:hypothetical protein